MAEDGDELDKAIAAKKAEWLMKRNSPTAEEVELDKAIAAKRAEWLMKRNSPTPEEIELDRAIAAKKAEWLETQKSAPASPEKGEPGLSEAAAGIPEVFVVESKPVGPEMDTLVGERSSDGPGSPKKFAAATLGEDDLLKDYIKRNEARDLAQEAAAEAMAGAYAKLLGLIERELRSLLK